MTHVITGEEKFLDHTLASIGIPKLHILRTYDGAAYRFYELTGDLGEALHFKHFEITDDTTSLMPDHRLTRQDRGIPADRPPPLALRIVVHN